MTEPRFRAVVFDLFDTLVDFRADLFPVVEINGKPERTTSIFAYEALKRKDFSLPAYEEFHRLWVETSKAVWGKRDKDPEYREVTSRERFGKFVMCLKDIPPGCRDEAAVIAMETHMERLIASTEFSPKRLEMLGRLRDGGLRIGLVSNFDNADAAHRLLGRTGITHYLDATLISGEAGYRKPAPVLYRRIAEMLDSKPANVLFVGDNFEADVEGPHSVGMSCAWLNPKGAQPPEDAVSPDYEIGLVEEVLGILGLEAA
ncbi:MAG: HAD family hydrolase [Nitrospinota bacterium]